MSDWRARLELAGARYDLYYLVAADRCPVQEFVDSLRRGDVQTGRKVVKALQKAANEGLPRNPEQCKQHEDDLWYLKRGQPRIFFIIRGRSLYFLSAYKKKTDRLDPQEVERARRIRDEFLEGFQEGMK